MKKIKLFYQFKICIDNCFKTGIDKHSYKKSGCKKEKIFSYAYRRNIIAKTNQLSNFLNDNYKEVKYIKDIRQEHINAFMEMKSETCSYCSMKSYYYFLCKLERMIRQEQHLKVNFTENVKIIKDKNIIRDLAMRTVDLDAILDSCEDSMSPAVLGIRLAKEFGLRASEICKLQCRDINLDDGILHVHEGKGKRSRDLKIDNDSKLKLCENIVLNHNLIERIVPLREDSLNAYLRRNLVKNNIVIYKDKSTGIHAIRKRYSKEMYNSLLKEGVEEKAAVNLVSKSLGHNDNRSITKTAYINSK